MKQNLEKNMSLDAAIFRLFAEYGDTDLLQTLCEAVEVDLHRLQRLTLSEKFSWLLAYCHAENRMDRLIRTLESRFQDLDLLIYAQPQLSRQTDSLLTQFIQTRDKLSGLIVKFRSKAISLLSDGSWNHDLKIGIDPPTLNREGKKRLTHILAHHRQKVVDHWLDSIQVDPAHQKKLASLINSHRALAKEILTEEREGIFIFGG